MFVNKHQQEAVPRFQHRNQINETAGSLPASTCTLYRTTSKFVHHRIMFAFLTPILRPTTRPLHHTHITPRCVASDIRRLMQTQLQNPIFNPSLLPSPQDKEFASLQEAPTTYYEPTPDTAGTKASLHIAQYATGAISDARRRILLEFPGIDAPGGALYPALRADACWRDLNEFCRVVGYWTSLNLGFSDTGFDVMKDAYQQLSVPMDALIVGVKEMRDILADGCDEQEVRTCIHQGFDELLRRLAQF